MNDEHYQFWQLDLPVELKSLEALGGLPLFLNQIRRRLVHFVSKWHAMVFGSSGWQGANKSLGISVICSYLYRVFPANMSFLPLIFVNSPEEIRILADVVIVIMVPVRLIFPSR